MPRFRCKNEQVLNEQGNKQQQCASMFFLFINYCKSHCGLNHVAHDLNVTETKEENI